MQELFLTRPILPLVLLMLAVVWGLCPENERRTGRPNILKGAGALGILAACMLLDLLLVDTANASTTLEPILAFSAGFAFASAVLRVPGKTAVFVTAWAQILIELVNQLMIPLAHRIADTGTFFGAALYFVILILEAAAVYLAARYALFPHLTRDGEYRMDRKKAVLAAVVLAMFLVLSNYQLIFWLISDPGANSGPIVPVFRMVAGLAALALMYLQNAQELRFAAQRELDTLQQLHRQREEQYRISSENIALINQKCHDIRHQIAALRTLGDGKQIDRQISEMENAVMIYDSAVKTQNPALDVVLTEKSLYCESNGINLTCLIDGRSLDFIDIVDLYSMFGNALDNAIESVMKEPDTDKRVIQVAGYREKAFFLIRVRNYCEKPPVLVDGMPLTTKQDTGYHGFGIRSIRTTAQKYGGDITIDTGANYFSLQILLPLPAAAREQGQS